jgi:putative PIN family toxin of toxin-antitoxin system
LKVRIVLDTSVVIAALRSNAGAAAEIVRLSLARRLTVLMDYKLACEYRDVALRPEQLRAGTRTRAETTLLLDAIEIVADPVMVVVRHRPLSQDPDDDRVLDVAINGGAEAIVTNNARHFRSAASRFQIATLEPGELLRRLVRER